MIVTGTVPTTIEDAFRNHPDVPPGITAGLWSVWALPASDLSRGSHAAVLAAYQFAVPGMELATEARLNPEISVADGQIPEIQSDTTSDEASPGARSDNRTDHAPPVVLPPMLLELPVRSGSSIQKMTGPLAEAILTAEEQIRSLAEAEAPERVWELRALHIPALYVEALWLHSLSGHPDIVLPYASGVNSIETFREQPLRRMLQSALRAAATRPVWPAV
jgi:hypothetical protein